MVNIIYIIEYIIYIYIYIFTGHTSGIYENHYALLSGEFHRTPSIVSGNVFMPIGQQAITWTGVDRCPRRRKATQGHNELKSRLWYMEVT